MREIKFRAWDKKFNKMNELRGYLEVSDGNIQLFTYNETGDKYSYTSKRENIVFMQYTGLKDKNGVEICEGDIFHMKGWWNVMVMFEYGQFSVIGADHVQFINRTINISIGNFPVTEYEIIGNIYENKELIN